MTDLLYARGQMTQSLAFHILFAVAGMAMPLLMVLAEWRFRKTQDVIYLELAERWAKGTAILFAVGAVSGTVLSFELGLLWPELMAMAGPFIGLSFSLEGFAFFLEAIFLGLYLYGRKHLSPPLHFFSGVMVAVSGLASGVFVMSVNAWMQNPVGWARGSDNNLILLDPWAAFKAPSFPSQAVHMALAAYVSVALLASGIHAWGLRRRPGGLHRAALGLTLPLFLVSMPLQLLSGDWSAKHVAEYQPIKLAAMEGHYHTQKGAPIAVLGWPHPTEDRLVGAIEVPYLLSLMAFADPYAEVKGLSDFPRDERPPVGLVHLAFDIMVGAGSLMLMLVGTYILLRLLKKPPLDQPLYLQALTWGAPLGLIALEAGWVVTEVGRQPWTVRGLLRTADAVTPVQGLWAHFGIFSLLYILLGVVVVVMLRAHVFKSTESTHD